MTDDHEYYHTPDHGHKTDEEYPLGPCMCVLALLGMFSYLCIYILEQVK